MQWKEGEREEIGINERERRERGRTTDAERLKMGRILVVELQMLYIKLSVCCVNLKGRTQSLDLRMQRVSAKECTSEKRVGA